MSTLQLPRSPAWDKHPPQRPVFTAASDEVNSIICAHLNIDGPLAKLTNNSTGLTGYYLAPASNKHSALFIKVVEQARAEPLLSADTLSCYAAGQGIPTPCLIADYTKPVNNDYFALTYPYYEARFAKLQNSDLSDLGRLISRLHRTLANAPWQQEVKDNSARRQALLVETQQRLDEIDKGVIHEDVIAIVKQDRITYPSTGWQAQIIHGDINYGNVLFPVETPGRPLILDFEDTALSWHSPLVDIAFIIERFILIRTENDDLAFSLAKNLINAFSDESPHTLPPAEKNCLIKILQTLSVRALCLLVNLTLNDMSVARSEWDKFRHLYYQTQKRHKLISDIETLLR